MMVFQSKIDEGFKYAYRPFYLLGAFLIIGLGLSLFTGQGSSYQGLGGFGKMFLVGALLEVILFQTLAKTTPWSIEKRAGCYYLIIGKAANPSKCIEIEAYDYWWNYDFGEQNYQQGENGDYGSRSYSSNGKSGGGPEPDKKLQLILQGKEGEIFCLEEFHIFWKKFPTAWEYAQEKFPENESLRTYRLRPLIKELKTTPMELKRKNLKASIPSAT